MTVDECANKKESRQAPQSMPPKTTWLKSSPTELRGQFGRADSPRAVSAMLEVDYESLTYWLYRAHEDKRYDSFEIGKRLEEP